jgi:hypothetical protein
MRQESNQWKNSTPKLDSQKTRSMNKTTVSGKSRMLFEEALERSQIQEELNEVILPIRSSESAEMVLPSFPDDYIERPPPKNEIMHKS